MAGYLASPSPHSTTLGTSPACNSEIPHPVAQSLAGVAVFPAPLYYLQSRQWNGTGRGLPAEMAARVSEGGEMAHGSCSPGARASPCRSGGRDYSKDGVPDTRPLRQCLLGDVVLS